MAKDEDQHLRGVRVKKKTKSAAGQTSLQELGQYIAQEWKRWRHMHDYGGSVYDARPCADGVDMMRVRRRIVWARERIEELSSTHGKYPDAYQLGVPDDLPMWYVADAEHVLETAMPVLEEIHSSDVYREWSRIVATMTPDEMRAYAGERLLKDARKIVMIGINGMEHAYQAGVRLAPENRVDDPAWMQANAEDLCQIRAYARRREHYIDSFAANILQFRRVKIAMQAGVDCRGNIGPWCEKCQACMAETAEVENGQLAWVV